MHFQTVANTTHFLPPTNVHLENFLNYVPLIYSFKCASLGLKKCLKSLKSAAHLLLFVMASDSDKHGVP